MLHYFYVRCLKQLHKLFTVKSSDCSILCLRYKLLTHIILYSYVKHMTDIIFR